MKISELPLAQSVSSTDDVPIDRSGVTYRVHYEELRGNGIASIAKTGTSGLVDTYTITFTDGSTFTYTVTNGASGSGSWGTITGTLSNQTDLQNALNAKANAADVYTKTQVDTALSAKADAADVYTKAQLDAVTDVTFSNISAYWTNGAAGSSLKKCGHIVTGKITILNTDTALPGTAYTDLGKVSAKPVDDISVTLAPVGGSDKRVAILVTSAGVVRAYNYNTTSSYTGTVLITYITND